MTIGERIRAVRKEKGLTQQALGQLLNVTQATVGQYETNRNPPKIPTLERIAAALGVSLEALTGVPESVRAVGIVGAEVRDELPDDARRVLNAMNRMNRAGREKVASYAEDLEATGRYEKA